MFALLCLPHFEQSPQQFAPPRPQPECWLLSTYVSDPAAQATITPSTIQENVFIGISPHISPNARSKSATAKLASHATPHWVSTRSTAHLRPSSRLTAATAATQGV